MLLRTRPLRSAAPSAPAVLLSFLQGFKMMLEDPQRAYDEWLGRVEGVHQPDLDVLVDVREWASWFCVLQPLPADWPQARRDEFAALGITYRCSCYEGCHYMVCAHVLAQHIHDTGLSSIPAAFSTVQVAPRAGAGMPQNGANIFGASSAHVRSRGSVSKAPAQRGANLKRHRGAT